MNKYILSILLLALINIGAYGQDELPNLIKTCPGEAPNRIWGTGDISEFTRIMWEVNDGSGWKEIKNATSSYYQPPVLNKDTKYRRVLVPPGGIFPHYSNVCTVQISGDFEKGYLTWDLLSNSNPKGKEILCNGEKPDYLLIWGASRNPMWPPRNKPEVGPYTYEAQKSTDLLNWDNVPIINNNSHIQPPELKETTYYRLITHSATCGSLTSDVLTINVYDTFDSGVIGNDQTICYETIPSAITGTEVTGADGIFDYQWQKSLNEENWTNIEGATSVSYQPQALKTTTYFKRIVNNKCGSTESNIVKITVYNQLLSGTISSPQTICYKTIPAKLTSTAAKGGQRTYSYQWQISYNGVTYENISDAITDSYRPEALSITSYFKLITTDGCGSVESNPIKVSVYDELVPGSINSDQTICYKEAPQKITGTVATGGDGSYSYQWMKSVNGISYTAIAGATMQEFQSGALELTTYFKRRVSDGCNSKESNSVKVEVRPIVSENNITTNQTICYNSAPEILVGNTMTGGDNNFTYQWKEGKDGVNFYDISGATSKNYQPTNLNKTTYYQRISNNSCEKKESNIVMIIVRPEFMPGSVGSNETIIYGNRPKIISPDVATTGGSGNYSYQWRQSIDGENWTNISGAKSVNYQPDNLTQTTYFNRQTIDRECGDKTTNTITITVSTENQLIGTIGKDQLICYKTAPDELISSQMDESQIIYQQWKSSGDALTWNDIPGATGANYRPPILEKTTYYKKKVTTSNNGELETNIVTITVKDKFLQGTIGSDQSLCKGNMPKPLVTLTSPNQNVVNKWESSNDGIVWNILVNEDKDYLELPELTHSTYYRKNVISQCGELKTSPILITVNPILIGGNIQKGQLIDYNGIPDLIVGMSATGGNGNYTYYWETSYNEKDWNQIPNETNINYQSPALKQTTYIRRVVSSGDCNIAFSNTVTITVIRELNSGSIGNNQTVCFNSIPEKILGTEASGGIGIFTYIWERSPDGTTWEQLYGKTLKDLEPTNPVTKTTYYRRKAISGTMTSISNIVRIDHLPEVITPQITYTDRYCKGANIIINSNLDKVSWYDENMNFVSNKSILTTTANESTKYYYQIENTIGCLGDLKEVLINVDYVDVNITNNAINQKSVENGERLTIEANVASNFATDKLIYTWTFDHQDEGWYETMFDASPSQYFHWKGWYDITLLTETPSGCKYITHVPSAFYVSEETKDERTKSVLRGTKESNLLDPGFGLDKDLLITVYPSLFNAALSVEIKNTEAKLRFVLFDISGKKRIDRPIEKGTHSIPTAHLAEGIYLIRILDKDGATLYTNKVIRH